MSAEAEFRPTDAELRLITEIRRYGFCSFLTEAERDNRRPPEIGDAAAGGRTIRADVIRRLLFGRELLPEDQAPEGDVPAARAPRVVIPPAMEIRGAIIVGELDLEDVKGRDHSFAPHVALEYCRFVGAPEDPDPDHAGRIDVSDGMLSRFSLKGSRFQELDARGAHFAGLLDLSECASSEEPSDDADPFGGCADETGAPQARCWVDLSGARLDVEMRARDAKLCAPKTLPSQDRDRRGDAAALDMRGAALRGDLKLTPGFEAIGGVYLNNLDCGGDVWLTGAKLVAKKTRAINLQYATIRGAVALNSAFDERGEPKIFQSHGVVRVYGAQIDGELWMSGAQLSPPPNPGEDREARISLMAYLARIGKRLRLQPATSDANPREGIKVAVSGAIVMTDAEVGGLELIIPAVAENTGDEAAAAAPTSPPALSLTHLRSKSSVDIIGGYGPIEMSDARVDGPLRFTDLSGAGAITLENARIEGDLEFNGLRGGRHCDLENIRVGGDVEFDQSICGAILAPNAQIEANFEVRAGCRLDHLDLPNARMGGNLSLSHAQLGWSADPAEPEMESDAAYQRDAARPPALRADNAEIMGRVSIQADTQRELSFTTAHVKGEFTIEGLVFHYAHPDDRQRLTLKGARIDGGLNVFNVFDFNDQMVPVRATPLEFYRNADGEPWVLVELEDRASDGGRAPWPIRAYLWDQQTFTQELSGLSHPIHRVNAQRIGDDRTRVLRLSDETVVSYLEFFCAFVWGEEGAFRLVDSRSFVDKEWRNKTKRLTASERGRAAASPTEAFPAAEGEPQDRLGYQAVRLGRRGWKIEVLIHYADQIVRATFQVRPNGFVEMLSDEALLRRVPQLFRYENAQRKALGGQTIEALPPALHWAGARWLEGGDGDAFIAVLQGYRKVVDRDLRRPALVDLSGLRTPSFDDRGTVAWRGNVRLDLENFVYDQLFHKPPEFGDEPAAPAAAAAKGQGASSSFGRASTNRFDPRRQDEEVTLRLRWFERQYSDDAPANLEEFQAQPYEHLAQLYRQVGRQTEARQIIEKRLALEGRLRANVCISWRYARYGAAGALAVGAVALVFGASLWATLALAASIQLGALFAWPLLIWIYGAGFGYGMSPRRALATFVVCLGIGALLADLARDGDIKLGSQWAGSLVGLPPDQRFVTAFALPEGMLPLLEVDTQPIARILEGGAAAEGPLEIPREAIPCGDEISPGLYAMDVFIPLLDLRQEMRCAPATEETTAAAIVRWVKAIYAMLGWVVTSLTLLTVAGVIKRRIES